MAALLLTFVLGALAGWVASMPVTGPISGLVFSRGLQGRYRAGTFIGLGGGLVEALYALLAFLGFGALLAQYPIALPLSKAAGAVVLLVVGLTLLKRRAVPPRAPLPTRPDSAWSSFALGAGVSGMNPTLLLTWSGFIATVHGTNIVDLSAPQLAVPLAAGCALGTTAWFAVLMLTFRLHQRRFRHETLNAFLRVTGISMLGLSAWFAWSFASYVQ